MGRTLERLRDHQNHHRDQEDLAEGLAEGESVVIDGQSLLSPKAKVALKDSPGAPAAVKPAAPALP